MSQWKWNKIVVGVDGSKESRLALVWACQESQRAGVPITVMSAWSVPTMPSVPPYGGFPWEGTPDIGAATRSMVTEMTSEVLADFPDLEVSQHVVSGNAAHELIKLSETADLVVVGARGHGGFAGMLIGSVSQHVLAHSACTVVVVR
jgi:nucleotide-binding universal stress UspA family protein